MKYVKGKNLKLIGKKTIFIDNDVKIGNNVIISANSVVTKSVPDGCIVAGIPAKIIGYTKDLDYDLFANPKDRDGWAPYLVDKKKEQ